VIRSLAGCGVAVLISIAPCLGGQSRLAIIGPPEFDSEMALLTAELSRRPDVALLERSNVEAVLKEQSLAVEGITLAGSIRLGALLKADGVLLLEKENQALTMRLVGVDSGAVVGFDSVPWPIDDPEAWANLEAQKVSSLAAKLKIPRAEIVPLSLMRITPLLTGPELQGLARNLDFLLAARLSANPSLVVLERARLEEAAAEKGFGVSEQPFWSSGWILEGSVAPSPSGYALEISLQRPGEALRHSKIEAAEVKTLVELANAAVLKVLAQKAAPWNPKDEAQRFFEEGRWAARNSLWEQATQALEAAVALGDASPEALEWQWRCHEAAALARRENAKGRSPAQLESMARALELYREILLRNNFPHGSDLAWRFPVQPQSFQSRFLIKSAGGQGTVLLAEAGAMLQGSAQPPGQTPGREAAIARLRQQMHALFDALESHFAELTITAASEGEIPAWKRDPLKTTENRDAPPYPINLHTERVTNGLPWEENPEAYTAYLQKCLGGEIAADPNFFQHACVILAGMAGNEFIHSRDPQAVVMRAVGRSLANGPSLRWQTAGAILLCRTGQPVTGMEIFARNREQILKGSLPVDFAVLAMKYDPSMQGGGPPDPSQSTSKALGVLKDLIIALLNSDRGISATCGEGLMQCRFNEVQITEMLRASQAFDDRKGAQTLTGPPGIPEFLLRAWRRKTGRNGETNAAPPLPRVQTQQPPVAQPPKVKPLVVDQAWFARNADDPSAAGEIRYADYAGGKIWLQVEYPASKFQPARREILTLSVPSLEKRLILRDTAPPASKDPFPRGGPTFAVDGETVFVWSGSTLDKVHGGETQPLKIPSLSDPRLWLIDHTLFVASGEGTLLRVDPASGQYEILASQMRRPAQTKLDAEHELKNVARIYRAADGSVAALVPNEKVFVYREAKKDWEEVAKSQFDWRPEIAEAVLHNGWDVRGVFLGESSDYFLTTQAGPQKDDKFGLRPAGGRYLEAVSPSSNRFRGMMVQSKAGVVAEGELWMMLEDPSDAVLKEWLLRMRLSDGRFGAMLLDFSPQYLASIEHGGATGGRRLIPTAEGLAIYTNNEPVLWFIPKADLPTYDHP